MNKLKAFAILATLGATMSLAGAQGMMFGAGGMSQGMVLMGFGPGGPTLRSDVSKEIKLTDDQKRKIEDFQQKQMDEMMQLFQSGQRPEQAELQKIMKKRQEDETKALNEILDEGQRKRLKELWVQRLGNSAIMNSDLQKELAVTDDQKKKISDLQTKQAEANRALFEKMQNGEIDRSEIRPMMEKMRKVLDEELGKLMTEDQKTKLKALGGTPFKFDEDNIG